MGFCGSNVDVRLNTWSMKLSVAGELSIALQGWTAHDSGISESRADADLVKDITLLGPHARRQHASVLMARIFHSAVAQLDISPHATIMPVQ